eukprot:TRINITY_DN4779_c0_g1_i9.p1 TRINITY_DN4779_c0_g1~~TRINITY_DN4779_c0_g1_i9.p1  ORF type:complete len:322 (+),score=78.78 TRINITY_DN4779_c0_g1_i9:74-1039(+)
MGDPEHERRVFVAGLPLDIVEDEIESVFGTYGKVEEVVLLDESRSRPGERCGFVKYATSRGASVAVQVLDGVYKFREESEAPVRVSIAKPRDRAGKGGGKDNNDRRGGNDYGNRGGYDSGYGKGGDYGKGKGKDKGGKAGKGGYDDRGYGHDRGWGGDSRRNDDYGRGYDDRSNYKGHGGYDDGKGKGKGKDKGHYDRYNDRDQGKGKGHGGGGGGDPEPFTKLYVGNLPDDITAEDLRTVFGHYGFVEDVHVMTGRSKSGQASAFVRYQKAQEAKNAIAAMETGYEIRPGEGNILCRMADGAKGGKGGKGGGGGSRYQPY